MADAADTSAVTTRYKGVRKRKWGKWVTEVRLPNSRERIWLGSYDSPEKAARAFDAGSFLLRGKRASLNFPERAQEIAIYCARRNPSPQQIQSAAARYAHAELQEPSQPSQPVLQAVEDSAPPPSQSPPLPPPPNQWEFMEQWMAPTFTGIDEFSYDLFHHDEQLRQMDLDAENSWDSAHSSCLWNF